MFSLSVALLAILPLINAQSTVSLFLPGIGDGSNMLVGSVAGSGKTATTYVVTCASASRTAASATPTSFTNGSDESDYEDYGCQIGPSALTLTQGPCTARVTYTFDPVTATVDCILDGSTSATCTASQTGANDMQSSMTELMETVPSVVSTTLRGGDISFLPVIITAGSAKGEATASSTDAAATANPAAGNVKSTGATKTGVASSTGGASNKPAVSSVSSSSASPAAAASTGGAALFDAPSTLGGSVVIVVGLAAAML